MLKEAQSTEQQHLNWKLKNICPFTFLPNAPLGFRKLQKIDGEGGGISGVSW